MNPQNNNNFPRTAGGYSLETYEPAVVRPEQKKYAEDLIKMAFADKKPMATVRRIVTRVPQYNIRPSPVLQNSQFPQVQRVPVMIPKANTFPISFVNQNQPNIYRFNKVQNVNPIPTVSSLKSNNNQISYQNPIPINNRIPIQNINAAIPINTRKRFIAQNFNSQIMRPVLRSNSATQFSRPMFQPKIVQNKIISGQNYQLKVYKRELL